MTDPDLLGALDPEQRQVAEALRGPVRVLAGAGTGKTRAITHRIAHGVAEGLYAPTEVLAVTFTTRAAGEMRGRLHRLGAPGVQARTFHSAALRQLRWFWPTTYGGELPTLTESKLALVAAAARRQRLHTDQALLRDLASEIEWAKVSNVGPDDYAGVAAARGRAVADLDLETVGRLFGGYEETKRSQSRMDMEDVLLLTAGMLAEEERVAAQVRAQYKWFVVDEFQDVSPIQSALLDLWLGGRDEICVVGDPAQTIYSFAGANADYLRDFAKKFPGTTSVELSRNYRSTPEVVEAANTVLAGSSTTSVRLRAQRPAGPPVRYVPTADEVAEADAVAEAVGRLVADGVPTSESPSCSGSTRSPRRSRRLWPAAASLRRPRRRAVLRARRGAAGGDADPGRRRTDGGATPVPTWCGRCGGMGWTPEAPGVRGARPLGVAAGPGGHGRGVGRPTAAEFVADLERRARAHAPAAGGVTLSTLHAAKGLALDAVFLAGVREGPISLRWRHPGRDEEERRLLYVGVAPRAAPPHGLLGLRPYAGWSWQPPPSRFTDRLLSDKERRAPTHPAEGAPHGRAMPRVRQAAVHRGREEARSVPRLPGVLRRGAVRATAGVAQGAGRRGRGAGLRRLHRRHAPAHRRAAAGSFAAALLRISGVGPAKLERYGDSLLEVVG